VDVQELFFAPLILLLCDAHPVLDTKTAFKTIIMRCDVDVFYDHFFGENLGIFNENLSDLVLLSTNL
jgi:hypothetical protein